MLIIYNNYAMKKSNLVFVTIESIINIGFLIFMIIHLAMNVTYTAQLAALFMILSGAIKLVNFFLNRDFEGPELREIFTDGTLIILGFIYMITKTNATVICISYGIIDIVDGSIGTGAGMFYLRHNKLTIIDTALCVGDITFGIILCFKLLAGLKGHLIFLTVTVAVYIIYSVLEIVLKKDKTTAE